MSESIDPSRPMTAEGLVPAYVWVQLEPVVPSSILATVLWQMHMSGEFNLQTLDTLAQQLLGVPIGELVAQMQTSAAELEAGQEARES